MFFLNDICFLCLLRNKNIKSVLLPDDDGIVVEEKLKYVLYSEYTSFKPGVPKNICIDCLIDLNYVYKFKQKCVKSMTDLSKYLDNHKVENNKCNFVSTSNTEYYNTELQSEVKLENIDQYSLLETQSEKNSEEVEIKIEQVEIHEDSSQQLLFDEECTEIFPEKVDIKEEFENDGEPPFIEDIQIDDDWDTKLEKPDNIVSTSTKEQQHDQLQNKKKSPKSYNCNECHKSFPFLSGLELHSRKHTGLRPFKCSICMKGFSKKFCLSQHIQIHNAVRSFQCTICEKAFKQQFHLTRHMLTHTDIKPFECEVCHKSFNKKCNLKDHERIHDNIRPFKCSICSKTFITNNTLTVHMRTHTKVNPFKCSVCNKAFSTSSGLTVHMRLHTGDRPYSCHICPRKFAASTQLKRHVKTHSFEVQHCTKCRYETTSIGNFKRHMKVHEQNLDKLDRWK